MPQYAVVKPKPKPHIPHPDMGDLAIHPKGSKAIAAGVGNQHLRVKLPRIRKGQ